MVQIYIPWSAVISLVSRDLTENARIDKGVPLRVGKVTASVVSMYELDCQTTKFLSATF